MLRPLDLQVLVARTHEVQKYQGVVTKQTESEEENFRRRLQNQVQEEQQQVKRKKNVLSKRIARRPGRDESSYGEQEFQGSEQQTRKHEDDSLGRHIDIEI